jgi:hypothetical protein
MLIHTTIGSGEFGVPLSSLLELGVFHFLHPKTPNMELHSSLFSGYHTRAKALTTVYPRPLNVHVMELAQAKAETAL